MKQYNTNMEKINLTSDLQCIERKFKTFVNFISIQLTAAPLTLSSADAGLLHVPETEPSVRGPVPGLVRVGVNPGLAD